MTRRCAALLAGASLLAAHGPAAAQTAFSLGFGETADAATGTRTGQTLFLALSRSGIGMGATLGAGLPIEPDRGSRWASAAAWIDAPDALAGLGILASAGAFGYADPVLEASGGAASGVAQAYAALDAGPLALRVRGGARAGFLASGDTTVRRALAVAGADATATAGGVVLRAATELWADADAVYPLASLQAVRSTDRLGVWAHLNRWLDHDLAETGWGVGAEFRVSERLALVVAAARPATDILFFSPPQRSWTLGLRYGGRLPPPPLPAPVFAEPGETVRIGVDSPGDGPEDAPVRIAGTFNGWEPEPMRAEDGRWVAELRLEPGIYEYAFVAADGTWFVPEDTPGRKADGFGGFVATIVVR